MLNGICMYKKDKTPQKKITPIVADNLSVSFGSVNILNKINFKIHDKDITAVISL